MSSRPFPAVPSSHSSLPPPSHPLPPISIPPILSVPSHPHRPPANLRPSSPIHPLRLPSVPSLPGPPVPFLSLQPATPPPFLPPSSPSVPLRPSAALEYCSVAPCCNAQTRIPGEKTSRYTTLCVNKLPSLVACSIRASWSQISPDSLQTSHTRI